MSSEVKPPAVTPVSDDDDSSHGGSTVDGAAAMEVDAEKSTENGESSTASPAAAAAAAAAAKAVPDDAEAEALRLKDLGNTALSEGHPLVAIQFYSTSLEYSPNNAIVLSNRAMAYIKVENYGLAILDATAAIKADPSYPKGFYRRGTAQFALGKAKAARKDFRSV
eukprot:137550-Ditylum_brightwellii.AAC.1